MVSLSGTVPTWIGDLASAANRRALGRLDPLFPSSNLGPDLNPSGRSLSTHTTPIASSGLRGGCEG